ncbi:EAL domain-containing protein [Cognatiluteimonas weifangensis]|uniref:GGDEF domain-containing response regulator n=1 Tax=Cognatiluteimonas weifangensis TaxID=2303539 RepID=A0A372DR90_9GAMM|nr:EAL domain-containing response regulator [Luteimonas weifangensis]RFP61897.1 GGDEF domain-containing response regulator [Luteimonas weifangensis]
MTATPSTRRKAAAANDAGSDAPERAEYPPAHYWRRWSNDAPAASAPQAAASDTVAAPDAAGDAAPGDDPGDAPYRVLVVEDDPAQALFAESVLGGAGIQVQTAALPQAVMPAMEQFGPDLVLMDLHMPGMSGTELTRQIRAHPAFAHTPIVFLTGDPDPERQFEVLENGADDFLSKPIRPRHLIAAVQSRVKRARALRRQRFGDATRHPHTGLYNRPYVLQRIAAALTSGNGAGALFVEIQNAAALHDRYGYAGFEQLMHDAGRRIGELAGACPSARLNDNAFLVFAPDGAPAPETLARTLRDGINHPPFEMDGMPQRLRTAIGYSTLQHGFADAGAVLDAVEQAARAARAEPIGLAAYVPPARTDASADLVEAMRAGLHGGAFELLFQPVVAVAGGEEAQFQALLRMRQADGRVHSAGVLVPAAEAAGLMPDIDRWVLQQAIDLLHRRREERHPVRLFVSQSPHTLARDLHAAWLLEMISSHAIDGPSLVIDLRLDDALVHSITLRQFCDQLMPAGVQFCLSQYAHGADAEALLSQLPLGYMRLAPRYSHAHADPQLRDELRTAIDRAHRLGLQVIGPQVEDPQGAATLWMSGIDLIQGNLVQQAAGELDFDFQNSVL